MDGVIEDFTDHRTARAVLSFLIRAYVVVFMGCILMDYCAAEVDYEKPIVLQKVYRDKETGLMND